MNATHTDRERAERDRFDRERSDLRPADADPGESTKSVVAVPPLAIRAPEAAQCLGISTRQLWSLTKAGRIPHVRIGRSTTYPVDALRDWLRRRAKGGK